MCLLVVFVFCMNQRELSVVGLSGWTSENADFVDQGNRGSHSRRECCFHLPELLSDPPLQKSRQEKENTGLTNSAAVPALDTTPLSKQNESQPSSQLCGSEAYPHLVSLVQHLIVALQHKLQILA